MLCYFLPMHYIQSIIRHCVTYNRRYSELLLREVMFLELLNVITRPFLTREISRHLLYFVGNFFDSCFIPETLTNYLTKANC